MSDDDRTFLVCVSCRVIQNPCAKSMRRKCSACGTPVWVSTASLIAAGNEAKLICLSCAAKLELPEGDIQPPTEGQLRELDS